TLGDEHRAPAPGRHQHQGGDDRLDAQDRDQETVPQAEQGAHTQGKEYRGERVPARDDPATGDRAGDGGHRPHGQVDTSGGDHQCHTDRDEQGRRTVAQDVDDTAVEPAVLQRDLEEGGVVGRVCEKQQDQGCHRPEEVVSDDSSRLHEATAVSCPPWAAMVAMTSSTVASVPLSSATLRRSRSTTTRSDTRITSSSSDEMNSTAIPSAASSATIFWICALAPTSIPRVGSSRMSRAGRVMSHRARRTFCWLPPDRLPMIAPGSAGRMSSFSMYSATRESAVRRGTGRAHPLAAWSARTRLSRTVRSATTPSALRSSEQKATPWAIIDRAPRGRIGWPLARM